MSTDYTGTVVVKFQPQGKLLPTALRKLLQHMTPALRVGVAYPNQAARTVELMGDFTLTVGDKLADFAAIVWTRVKDVPGVIGMRFQCMTWPGRVDEEDAVFGDAPEPSE